MSLATLMGGSLRAPGRGWKREKVVVVVVVPHCDGLAALVADITPNYSALA